MQKHQLSLKLMPSAGCRLQQDVTTLVFYYQQTIGVANTIKIVQPFIDHIISLCFHCKQVSRNMSVQETLKYFIRAILITMKVCITNIHLKICHIYCIFWWNENSIYIGYPRKTCLWYVIHWHTTGESDRWGSCYRLHAFRAGDLG